MRKLLTLAAVGVLFSLGLGISGRPTTRRRPLKGDGMCAKCALKETETCQNVVIVTKDGEKKTYYIVHDKVAKDAHGSIGFCRASKEKPAKVKITGTFKEEGRQAHLHGREDREGRGLIRPLRLVLSRPGGSPRHDERRFSSRLDRYIVPVGAYFLQPCPTTS